MTTHRLLHDQKWQLEYDEFVPAQQALREALCVLGNGYFCTRGAAPEARADEVHYPGTYLAGGYDRRVTEIAGRAIENEDLVNFPNWLPLEFRLEDGEWFDLREVEILEFDQQLDLWRGVLRRAVRFVDDQGRTTHLRNRRFVHIVHQHLAGQAWTIEALDWSGTIEVRAALDGRVDNEGVDRYGDLEGHHQEPIEMEHVDEESFLLKARTLQSNLTVALCARIRIRGRHDPLEPERQTFSEPDGLIGQRFELHLSQGRPRTVEKLVALYTDRDRAISECGLEARQRVARAGSFDDELEAHVQGWRHLWRRFDIDLELREAQQGRADSCVEGKDPLLVLRLHVFHLIQTASPHTMDLDVGVPARGWHGEAYRGHIFWDELFIFPMINLRMPEITRSLLRYRYRRLDRARQAARQAGYRGAMFPWQSGSDGREESQRLHLNPRSGNWNPDNTHLQRHVSADIAYNVWQYYQTTDDLEFLTYYGAEMILEIARFWASIASWDEQRSRYVICGVMGPDEYHDAYPGADEPGLDNNAFTNVMAAWVAQIALETLDRLSVVRRDELRDRLDLGRDELERWAQIAEHMYVPFLDDDQTLIAQFEGYGELEEFDWEGYRDEYDDIQRLDRILEAEDDTPNHYKASKQADVVMLFYLFSRPELFDLFERLGYELDERAVQRNIDYYMQRTSHGSTLSRLVHSYIIASCDRARSWEMFIQTLHSDVSDIQGGTTPEGIHLGAMAGTVDLVQRVYAGIELRGDGVLWLCPSLPEELERLHIDVRFRGHGLSISLDRDRLRINDQADVADPIRLGFDGQVHELRHGEALDLEL